LFKIHFKAIRSRFINTNKNGLQQHHSSFTLTTCTQHTEQCVVDGSHETGASVLSAMLQTQRRIKQQSFNNIRTIPHSQQTAYKVSQMFSNGRLHQALCHKLT